MDRVDTLPPTAAFYLGAFAAEMRRSKMYDQSKLDNLLDEFNKNDFDESDNVLDNESGNDTSSDIDKSDILSSDDASEEDSD